jgi:hypothetical protein
VVQVEITSADGSSGNLDNNVLWLADIGDGSIDHSDILVTEPSEGSHGLATLSVLVLRLGGSCRVSTYYQDRRERGQRKSRIWVGRELAHSPWDPCGLEQRLRWSAF